jgi:uncharacterized membrane protein YqgA involved in biofilm formation
MIGTLVNVAGILLGGLVGLVRKKPLSAANESMFKVLLGAFTVFYGLRLTWISLHGSFGQVLKQMTITLIALILGRIAGQLLRLQKFSNEIGQQARERIAAAISPGPRRAGDGFKVCAALFCAAPLGIVGSIQDGVSDYFYPLCVKGAMEGLATFGFVSLFGWGSMLAAVPVLALQGTITLLCKEFVRPFLDSNGLVDPINAVGGLIVFSVALVILELKKIELANYLPALLFAPLIAWIWK